MVVTSIQREWLERIEQGKLNKRDDPHKWSVYMKRIRERIDSQIENLLWIVEHMPEVFMDAEYEIQKYGTLKRRRLKALMIAIKYLYPDLDVELVKLRRELNWPS